MKIRIFALMALLSVSSVSSAVYAAEAARPSVQIDLLNDSTMKKMMKTSDSSEQHHVLAALMGEWNVDLKYWSKKDAEPQISMGTVKNEMVLGGRFLSSRMNAILNIGGQNIPYEGLYLLGYDGIKKSYTSTLADTIHAGITTSTGQYDEKLKTITAKGSFTDPLMDKERTYRSELQVEGGDSYKQTIFIPDSAGSEFKVLELTYRRKM